jgi:ABC-type histidine transport system ATPase subunit
VIFSLLLGLRASKLQQSFDHRKIQRVSTVCAVLVNFSEYSHSSLLEEVETPGIHAVLHVTEKPKES